MASDEKPPFRERVAGHPETSINDMPTDKNNLTNTARNENHRSENPQSSPKRAIQVFRGRPGYGDEKTAVHRGDDISRQTVAASEQYPYQPPYEGSHSSSDHNCHHIEYPHPRHVASVPSSESTTYAYHAAYPPHVPAPHHPSYPIPGGYGIFPTAPHSSSFESHGRSSNNVPPLTPYSYPPPNPYQYYPWVPPPPVEYITDIKPNDVLSGRGGATNSHSGNRAFRSLVKQYQDKYLKAKKRDKPAVASIIVETIRDKGGRFLRRIDTTSQGQVLWVDIGDDRAREKTCQALREGAPELRRKKRKVASADEEDTKRSDYNTENDGVLSASSSIDRAASIEEDDIRGRDVARRTPIVRKSMHIDYQNARAHHHFPKDEPIMIRPSAALVRRRMPEAISVDQLDSHDRELYLRDFLPPNPAIRENTAKSYFLQPSAHVFESSKRDENVSPWPVVKV